MLKKEMDARQALCDNKMWDGVGGLGSQCDYYYYY